MELVQGSKEWLAFRKKRIGSSDAPIIMGVSPWSTPYQLWRDKTGRVERDRDPNKEKKPLGNWALERGNRWEPMARSMYELRNDLPMKPVVLIHPKFAHIIASLDGFNEEARRILEIKIPGKETFEAAKRGIVHEKYIYQLEHQLEVTGAEQNDFFCAKVDLVDGRERITDTALVEYKSNPKLRETLLAKEQEFYGFLERDEPPPLCEKDTLVIETEPARELFRELKVCTQIVDAYELASKRQRELIAEIKPFITHKKVSCEGVKVFKRKNQKDGEYLDIKLAG